MDWIKINSIEDLPKEPGEYLVYVKDPYIAPDHFEGFSYVTMAFFDKDQCLWREADDMYYNACVSIVNKEKIYYISHWAHKPSEPVDCTELEGEIQNGSN